MKIILIISLFTLSLMGADDAMMNFANAECKVSAELIPTAENQFEAKEGTAVKIHIALNNSGDTAFTLSQEFLKSTLDLRSKEIPLNIKTETFTQVQNLEIRLRTLKARRQAVDKMSEEQRQKYCFSRLGKKFANKSEMLIYLADKQKRLEDLKVSAAHFDKTREVLPGAQLYFEVSTMLPACDQKLGSSCELSVHVVNSDNKRIKFPVKALFY